MPATPTSVWGIDPSSRLIAIGVAPLDHDGVSTSSFQLVRDGQDGERLSSAANQMHRRFLRLAETHPPQVVWVEQPAGRVVMPVLSYLVGVLLATVFEATSAPTFSLPPGKWKKPLLGNGNASKEVIAAWAREEGIGFSNQDEADAAGIAVVGRLMVRERRFDV